MYLNGGVHEQEMFQSHNDRFSLLKIPFHKILACARLEVERPLWFFRTSIHHVSSMEYATDHGGAWMRNGNALRKVSGRLRSCFVIGLTVFYFNRKAFRGRGYPFVRRSLFDPVD